MNTSRSGPAAVAFSRRGRVSAGPRILLVIAGATTAMTVPSSYESPGIHPPPNGAAQLTTSGFPPGTTLDLSPATPGDSLFSIDESVERTLEKWTRPYDPVGFGTATTGAPALETPTLETLLSPTDSPEVASTMEPARKHKPRQSADVPEPDSGALLLGGLAGLLFASVIGRGREGRGRIRPPRRRSVTGAHSRAATSRRDAGTFLHSPRPPPPSPRAQGGRPPRHRSPEMPPPRPLPD